MESPSAADPSQDPHVDVKTQVHFQVADDVADGRTSKAYPPTPAPTHMSIGFNAEDDQDLEPHRSSRVSFQGIAAGQYLAKPTAEEARLTHQKTPFITRAQLETELAQEDEPEASRTTTSRNTLAREVVRMADVNRSGALSMQELMTWLPNTKHEGFMKWLTHRNVWHRFDTDMSGAIEVSELVKAVSEYYNVPIKDLREGLKPLGKSKSLPTLHPSKSPKATKKRVMPKRAWDDRFHVGQVENELLPRRLRAYFSRPSDISQLQEELVRLPNHKAILRRLHGEEIPDVAPTKITSDAGPPVLPYRHKLDGSMIDRDGQRRSWNDRHHNSMSLLNDGLHPYHRESFSSPSIFEVSPSQQWRRFLHFEIDHGVWKPIKTVKVDRFAALGQPQRGDIDYRYVK